MCFRLYHAIIVRYRLACWQTFTYAICLPVSCLPRIFLRCARSWLRVCTKCVCDMKKYFQSLSFQSDATEKDYHRVTSKTIQGRWYQLYLHDNTCVVYSCKLAKNSLSFIFNLLSLSPQNYTQFLITYNMYRSFNNYLSPSFSLWINYLSLININHVKYILKFNLEYSLNLFIRFG